MSLTNESMWRTTGESLVQLFGGECKTNDTFAQLSGNLGTAAWALTGLPYPDLNMGIVSAEANRENSMNNVVQRCNARKIPCLVLSHDADDLCREMGMQEVGFFPLMHLSANCVVQHEDDGACKLATCDSEVQEGNLVVSSAFGLPVEAIDYAFGNGVPKESTVRVYIAKRECAATQAHAADQASSADRTGASDRTGRVVCSLRISQVGQIAVLWCMATEPSLQRQGIGKRLLRFALSAEKELGAVQMLLLATPNGLHLYQAVGFKTVAQASAFLISSELNGQATHPSSS